MPDLLEEAVKAAEHLERRGAFDQARAVRELIERVEQAEAAIRADHAWHAEQAGRPDVLCACEICQALATHQRETP